jgi:hypothetical protein
MRTNTTNPTDPVVPPWETDPEELSTWDAMFGKKYPKPY